MDYSFGNWVKRRRKSLDLTQQELAKRVGCSISLIFKIESDERRPSRQIAELLAAHLGLPPDQRDLFMKVARQQRSVDHLEALHPLHGLVPAAMHYREDQPAPVSHSLQAVLPHPLTALIGREHEIRALIRQIGDPACRLLTLTGPGGVGKTRLALEVAHLLRDSFEYGASFVSLVGTSSPEFIIPAIADSLGFTFSGPAELKAQLFQYLKDKQILLVLDNLEHLLDGIEVVGELLAGAPRLKLLATSREQLNLRAEWRFEVQGLPVPEQMDKETFESNSAALLFIQRAKQADLKFNPARDDYSSIMRICQLVEGLPLGLELAASWLRMMPLKEIVPEIERNIDFLATTGRDVPERHRSMRAVFDSSWNLLSDDERRILRQLAIFRGGFTRQAAERVAGANLSQLLALVDKSLLRRSNAHTGWYTFHELVRQYTDHKLQDAPEEHHRTRDIHAGYYASLLHEWEGQLQGPRQKEILAQASLEIDNLHLAWHWMVKHRQASNLQKSLSGLFVLYDIRNWSREGSLLFGHAVAALESSNGMGSEQNVDEILLGELMACQGHLCWHLGQTQLTRELLQQSLEYLSPHEDRAMLAEAVLYLAILEHSQGNFPAARQLAEECVSLNRRQGRPSGTGYALSNLGIICLTQGEYQTAYDYLEESIALMRSIEHPRGIATGMIRLGTAALQLGKLSEAQDLLEESLEITRLLGDRWGFGNALNYLGLVAFARGDLDRAEARIRESAAIFEEDSDQILLASSLADLGYIHNQRGALSDARQVFRQALRKALNSGAIPVSLYALAGIATLYAREGATERALELVSHILQHPSNNWHTRNLAEQLRRELETQIAPQQFGNIQTRTKNKTFEALMQEMLAS